MNRLIIIGNGFDLAHGLPTSYRSFLDWIWRNFSKIKNDDLFKNLFNINIGYFTLVDYKDYSDFYNKIRFEYSESPYSVEDSHYGPSSFKVTYKDYYSDASSSIIFEFKNKFFELITVQNVENWVDIENTYYQVLLSIIKENNFYPLITSIEQLNSEFLEIKKLLEYYLLKEVNEKYFFEKKISELKAIFDLLEFKRIKDGESDKLFLEFPASYRRELKVFNGYFTVPKIMDKVHLYDNLFLDFNYTKNIDFYVDAVNKKNSTLHGRSEHIQIHGKIEDSNNSINFGFGDEMDDHYKVLESTGDNKFLENIKSFMYFNNSNYRKLLNWIENKDYQVFIMGHSCGLSDRTLLNTLFEHNNCKSIKIFYHQKADGSDNFTELSQNISRHFNKKSMMREKVVDKSLSVPLPQTVRYDLK